MYNTPTKKKKVNILSDIGLLVPEFGLLCDQKKSATVQKRASNIKYPIDEAW